MHYHCFKSIFNKERSDKKRERKKMCVYACAKGFAQRFILNVLIMYREKKLPFSRFQLHGMAANVYTYK